MRAIFGVMSLLIVLAIVGSLARKNLQAFGGNGAVAVRQAAAASQAASLAADPSGDGRTVAVPGGMAADIGGLTAPQQAKALHNKVRDDTVRALQQGAERTQRADPN